MHFWVQAQQGAKRLSEDGERDMTVPSCERSPFEVIHTEPGFQFAVVVLDAPADLRQPDEGLEWGAEVHGGQPVLGGFGLVRGPLGDQPFRGKAAVGWRVMCRLA